MAERFCQPRAPPRATTSPKPERQRLFALSCKSEGTVGDTQEVADGGAASSHSPVAGCTSALRSRIEVDEQAKVCSDSLRVCLDDALPNRGKGQENRPDAGKAEEEHGNGNGKPEQGDRGASEEQKPSDAGVAVDDDNPAKKPANAERDGGRGKPQT